MIIDKFRGDWEFLSNMSPYGFTDRHGAYWKTNEHWYQAAKTPHPLLKMFIWDAETPYLAKKLVNDPKRTGNLYNRKSFNKVKDQIMYAGLVMKFEQNEKIREKLISTDNFELVEGNMWHDNYWGDCKCMRCSKITGLNTLGRLLMTIRASNKTLFMKEEK